ncbi:class F sortase [Kutzneria buriramensis]|uniref:Sortase family protein n=1 Tax=Kutzneria buriramensis TaxID=1045776 RepID=A0A3E0HAI6_9PSEU|nr:class F sortase [Kutzneria buriramensis]REH41035.1 sortase family protein [Kutzneria buriramensis]
MEPTLHIPNPGQGGKPSGRRTTMVVVGALVAVFALVGVAIGIFRQGTPENTALTSSVPATQPTSAAGAPTSAGQQQAAPPADNGTRSGLPVRVDVDAINAHSSLVQLGLNADRTVQVPPVDEPLQAGWYKFGVRPGEVGKAVILGHVDGGGQLGVFNRLRDLKPGDVAKVTEQGGQVLNFVVRQVQEVPKSQFPTQAVYGPSNQRELRLITCGGAFDKSSGNYVDNIIVSAVLTA